MKYWLWLSAFTLVMYGCSIDDNSDTSDDFISVASVNPPYGSSGTIVTITGTNFGTDPFALAVLFGNAGRVAAIQSISDKQVVAKSPTTPLKAISASRS